MTEVLQSLERAGSTSARGPRGSWPPSAPPEGLDTALFDSDGRGARLDLRRQIATMEAELAGLFTAAFPRKGIEFGVPAPAVDGPKVLSVGELERLRDAFAARIASVRASLRAHTRAEEESRELIERMSADPASYKWARVSNAHIGEPGCRNWHSRPRWGLLGMAMGWWRVKVSSGCPLAEAPA